MKALEVLPSIYYFDTFEEFVSEFHVGAGDLIVTNQWLYDPYLEPLDLDAAVIYQEKYGSGEPSDLMIDAIISEMKNYEFDRVIALGGGTIIDICKILALDVPEHSVDLFTGSAEPRKIKKLVLIPTTCGTGSEVTNVSVAELKSLHTKKGLATNLIAADAAVLIPQSLENLPDKVFATSSIDALIHATESYLSPKASPFTEMYSLEAIRMILSGYRKIIDNGNDKDARKPLLKDFSLASNYAGIAFGNAGCGAVHALSYAIGGAFHVPHGEANYQFFTEVFKMYMRKAPEGKIASLNQLYGQLLGCSESSVYEELDQLLGNLIEKKPLREYGMTEGQIDEFTQSTIDNQQRLLNNNYVPLSADEIREIYANLY